MAASGLNEDSVEKRLMSVTNTQDSIQSLSLWIIHHKTHHARIVELWYKAIKKSVKPSHRLTLFYLCNDVVQTCKRKKATIFAESFKSFLEKATALVRDETIKPKVERIFTIWEERQVFPADFVAELKAVIGGKEAEDGLFKRPHSKKSKKLKGKEKEVVESPSLEEFDAVQPADATLEPPQKEEEEKSNDDDAPTEETLAMFKPAEMIEKMTIFRLQEAEVDMKMRNLTTLKLDASSIEAIKQLKDRAHGNEFSTQFEESCQRLEDAVKALGKKKGEQKELMDQLKISEYFYDQQYREARIVANAYKNYGSRINTMKRKLEELMKALPEPSPSPPAHRLSGYTNLQQVDMDLDMDNGHLDDQDFEDDDIPSPPDEAPSPVGSLPEDDDDDMPPIPAASARSSNSLEQRLASFMPSMHSAISTNLPKPVPPPPKERPIPVYVPSTGQRRMSANKVLTDPDMLFSEDTGGGTPLTDERPSTPVMDEESSESPPPPPPPKEKKKENPIDFLSRLISQTQKNKPAGPPTSNSSFMEGFSMLTTTVKEQIDSKKGGEDVGAGGSVSKSWAAWKAEKAAGEGGMEPISMSIPPPPLPTFGLPPPPPPVSMAPPMPPPILPMSMPPPMPLASPTGGPYYQHTSPGQKENWPDAEGLDDEDGVGGSGDGMTSPNIIYPPVQESSAPLFPILGSKPVKSILRKSSHQSVLKELTRSSDDDTSMSSLPPPPPPPVSMSDSGEGSAIATLGSGSSSSEAQEFREKLKRKTSSGSSTPPAYITNPTRPNLMTLTPGGEMDMDIDEEEEEEDEPRIPVLSSVVRRVLPQEQKQAREKEKQMRREHEQSDQPDKHYSRDNSSSSYKERRYSRENSRENDYYPPPPPPTSSGYDYRDDESFGGGYGPGPEPEPYYPPYMPNPPPPPFYGPREPFNDFPFRGRPPFHKRPFNRQGAGNFRGGNHRNFNNF